ncbi:hypothetical protein FACS1894184_15500 [Clostridia bacterium]|nr:hypothetical protein FACS1894184_15500 [Clostridia bacterium]
MTAIESIKELTLLLLYLTSWEEKEPITNHKFYRAWKNHDWETIDKLVEEELIYDKHGRKSVNLSDKGVEMAEELIKKYGIAL